MSKRRPTARDRDAADLLAIIVGLYELHKLLSDPEAVAEIAELIRSAKPNTEKT